MSRRGGGDRGDRDRSGSSNVSLYVRHISDNTRPDDLRRTFEKYGPIKDIYIPMDYYTRRARGFAYVEYEEPRDAEDAMHELDHYRMNGREIEIEFAQGDRKTSHQMRNKYGAPVGGGGGGRGDRGDRGDRDRGDRRRRSRSRSRERSGRGDRGDRGGERRRRSRSRSKSRSRSRDSRQKRRRSQTRSKSPADKSTNNDKEKETPHSDGAGSDYVEETAD